MYSDEGTIDNWDAARGVVAGYTLEPFNESSKGFDGLSTGVTRTWVEPESGEDDSERIGEIEAWPVLRVGPR
jgi:hypothetical protein